VILAPTILSAVRLLCARPGRYQKAVPEGKQPQSVPPGTVQMQRAILSSSGVPAAISAELSGSPVSGKKLFLLDFAGAG
jgi:hypothetical protein